MIYLLIFVVSFLLSLSRGINLIDESWFFQVICRMNQGETLYRDIFLGVTPLSAYIGSWAVKLFGEELLVMKGVLAALFTASIWVTKEIGNRLHLFKGTPWFLVLTFFALSERTMMFSSSLYNPVSNLCFLLCFLFLLRNQILVAALFAALCFSAKQTHGIYALLCLVASCYATGQKKEIRAIILFFTLIAAALCIEIYLSGGFSEFLDYCYVNKTNYLRFGRISYFKKENFTTYLFPLFYLPPLLLAAFFYRGVTRLTKEALLLLIFLVGSLINVYPRCESDHMALALPLLLLALIENWKALAHLISERLFQWIPRIAFGWCALICTALAIQPFTKPSILCQIPHFKNIPVDSKWNRAMLQEIEWIEKMSIGSPLFLLMGSGGFYYLAAGIKNPTPFDYPSRTSFGLRGEQKVLEKFKKGELRFVCRSDGPVNKTRSFLEQHIKQTFQSPEERPTFFVADCIPKVNKTQ